MGAHPRRRRWPRWLGGAGLALVLAFGVCEWLGWPFLAGPMQRSLSGLLARPVQLSELPSQPGTGVSVAAASVAASAAAPNRPSSASSMSAAASAAASTAAGMGSSAETNLPAAGVRLRLLGGLRLEAAHILIGAPAWSQEPHTLMAEQASLRLRYIDLWRARKGQPLRIHDLRAERLDLRLERLADGRASWQFGPPKPAGSPATAMPVFEQLQVAAGSMVYRDRPLAADVNVVFALVDGQGRPASAASLPASGASGSGSGSGVATGVARATGAQPAGLQAEASGRYRGLPLKASLRSSGLLPWLAEGPDAAPVPVTLDGSLGRAELKFRGTATDILQFTGLKGAFSLSGPSLAAVGDPLGVTLPTTEAFRMQGLVHKDHALWRTRIDQATIGASQLRAALSYDGGQAVPLLSGRVWGPKLVAADLGPALGAGAAEVTPAAAVAGPDSPLRRPRADRGPEGVVGTVTQGVVGAASAVGSVVSQAASSAAGAASDVANTVVQAVTGEPPVVAPLRNRAREKPGRVLPDRRFDLPALQAMNANVLIDIDHVDLGTTLLRQLEPLRGHLLLADGVLRIEEIDARTADGSLRGRAQLDGRGSQALWLTDLRISNVRLEKWVSQKRAEADTPYISGALSGRVQLNGEGRSTAEILASLRGDVRAQLRDGKVSHLIVEAAGLDIAQALGVYIRGDEPLPVQCALIDLQAERGVLRPRVMVLDTRDSTLWADGTVSLADESMNLRAVVTPKDFSPLALRTPVRVEGSLSNPEVSLEKGALLRKLGGVGLLAALVNPLVALIPLMDFGSADDPGAGAGCKALVQKARAERPAAG